jgi:hypothetical protein
MTDYAYPESILRGIVVNPERLHLDRIEDSRGILFRVNKASQAGMSGSPIVARDGIAIGVVTNCEGGDDPSLHTDGMSPSMLNLPALLLRTVLQKA